LTYDPDLARDNVLSAGFYVWRGFEDLSRCAALLDQAEGLLRSDAARRFPNSTRLWELYRYGADMVDLMGHPELLALVAGLLGPCPVLSDLSLNQVRDAELPDIWHIDYPFSHMGTLVSGSLLGVQCIMPLDEFTDDNGATQLVPGSHRRYRHPPAAVPDQDVTIFTAAPGDLLIIAASTWHRAGINLTGQPRTAVLFSFVESWIRPMTGPPEDGPWSATPSARLLLGMERPARNPAAAMPVSEQPGAG
jgi:hypothetical protein